MKTHEMELASELLSIASDTFADHICTDFEFPSDWTTSQIQNFVYEYHCWNEQREDPQEFDVHNLRIMDWEAMSFLASKLAKVAKHH